MFHHLKKVYCIELENSKEDNGKRNKQKVDYPVKRSNNIDSVGSHYVTPETHAAYAFTWWDLHLLILHCI